MKIRERLITWGSALLNITSAWSKVHTMHDVTLEYQIDVHLLIAEETMDPLVRCYHLNFADACALELANRKGWFQKERDSHKHFSEHRPEV